MRRASAPSCKRPSFSTTTYLYENARQTGRVSISNTSQTTYESERSTTSNRPFPKEQGIHCFVRPGFSLISLILIPLTTGSSLYISSAAYMHIGLFSVGVSASVLISYASSFFCWESRLQDESTRRSKAGLEDARNAGRFTFFFCFYCHPRHSICFHVAHFLLFHHPQLDV